MPDELVKLQDWYAAQCEDIQWDVREGETPWQDKYGLRINTSDNPAWNVIIDLAGTDLDGVSMPLWEIDNSDDDWVRCLVGDNQFWGVGDPSKLVVILNKFFELVERAGSPSS